MSGEKQHCVKGDDCGILGNHTHPDALGVQRGIAVAEPNVTTHTPTPVPSEVAETTAGEHLCGRGCQRCADHDPRDRRDHGHLTPEMCPACSTSGEHDPRCYQSTGVPDDLPAGLCDCKVLRMLDAAETTAGEREVEALAEVFRHVGSPTRETLAHAVLASDWLAAHDDRVRREEGAKVLREAAEALDTEEAAIDTALIGVDYVIQRLRDRAASVGRGEGL